MFPLLCDLNIDRLSLEFIANPPLQSVNLYLLLVTTLALGAAAAFFALVRGDADPAYRTAVVLLAIVCGIGCVTHRLMTVACVDGGGAAPASLRYVDWLLTTPLMLLTFPLLLRSVDGGNRRMGLIAMGVAMMASAFVAETSPVDSGRWWTFFLVSCLFQLLIVAVLCFSLGRPILEAPSPLSAALERMRLWVILGWLVYPTGFLLAWFGQVELREILHTAADGIIRIGFCVVAWMGIDRMSGADDH